MRANLFGGIATLTAHACGCMSPYDYVETQGISRKLMLSKKKVELMRGISLKEKPGLQI